MIAQFAIFFSIAVIFNYHHKVLGFPLNTKWIKSYSNQKILSPLNLRENKMKDIDTDEDSSFDQDFSREVENKLRNIYFR